MSDQIMMIVSLRIPASEEARFTEFYHHRYIPSLLYVVPEIEAVWRYEEFGVTGSLRWFSKQFLTHYLFKPGVCVSQIAEIMQRPGREEQMLEWAQWKENHLIDVQRHCFTEIYRHPRQPLDGIFGSRPFFRVTVQTDGRETAAFNHWYHHEYLPKIMADVPAWAATRRYASVDRKPELVHTVYEVESVHALDEAFLLMRAPYRFTSNADWDAWVGKAIVWQDATSFRPIYRAPN
jgi:hypothetical protein